MFKRENKYLVLKLEDIKKYLEKYSTEHTSWEAMFWDMVDKIEKGRIAAGKKDNSYVVVNEDEPYAEIVWKLIEISQTNPEGLEMLLGNLEVEFAAYGLDSDE